MPHVVIRLTWEIKLFFDLHHFLAADAFAVLSHLRQLSNIFSTLYSIFYSNITQHHAESITLTGCTPVNFTLYLRYIKV
jgi:hypothetical protein